MFEIMIVEDDQTIANLIAENLEKWQLKAILPKDFNAIFDQFLTDKPHLILLDINLPVYDAFTGAKKFVKFQKCLSSLSPAVIPTWIW